MKNVVDHVQWSWLYKTVKNVEIIINKKYKLVLWFRFIYKRFCESKFLDFYEGWRRKINLLRMTVIDAFGYASN